VATGVRVIDTATGKITAMLPTEHLVFPIHATSNGLLLASELHIAEGNTSALGRQRTGQLSVFSTGSHELRGIVEVGQFPLTITSSPDGALGYVACVVSSTLEVIDLAHLRLVATLNVDRRGEAGAHGLAYVPSAC
jgi:DNA-binding beta-propeller fold protein YncE